MNRRLFEIMKAILGTAAGIAGGITVVAALMVLGWIALPIWFCAQIAGLIHSIFKRLIRGDFGSAQTAKTSGKEPPAAPQP